MAKSYQELEVENARLRAENRRLSADNQALTARVRELSAIIETLTAHIEKLTARVEQLSAVLEAAERSGKRQAAPFRKAEGPKAEPKKPGRKSGPRHGPRAHRTAPTQIDEKYDVPLPKTRPHCGGRHVSESEVTPQYQTEIPRKPIHRQFDIHVGWCPDCGQRVQGRHALQTSDTVGAAASQLGPEAHAALVILNKDLGLSHGKCARCSARCSASPSRAPRASVRTCARRGRRNRPMPNSGFRCGRRLGSCRTKRAGAWGGRNAWLHGLVGESATCYEIGDRSGAIAEGVLGLDWAGTLIHDGWSVYDRFARAFHQQCLGHLQRRCRRMLETAVGAAARLPRAILKRIDQAFAVRRAWRGHRTSANDATDAALWLGCELERLVHGAFTHEPNRRLAAHVARHSMHWFWFLIDPTIDATIYRAEQAMRPAVVNRKVWGGNRTWIGARAQSVLMSAIRTLFQRGAEVLPWFSLLRRSQTPLLIPP